MHGQSTHSGQNAERYEGLCRVQPNMRHKDLAPVSCCTLCFTVFLGILEEGCIMGVCSGVIVSGNVAVWVFLLVCLGVMAAPGHCHLVLGYRICWDKSKEAAGKIYRLFK